MEKFKVIKKLVETNGNKKAAAKRLDCTGRHINRMIVGYREFGKEFFVHGNRKHKPVTTIPLEVKKDILELYQTKYAGANLTHFKELLAEFENIKISVSSISKIFEDANLLSPKAHRSTKKKLKKKLKALQSKSKTKKEKNKLQTAILDLDEAHPRRPRCQYFGEMIQMDASEFIWFGDIKTHLHVAIDDSTGTIVGMYFDHQETLNGYYNVLHRILTNYGIPYQFLTDNRTVFEYKRKNSTSLEKDTFTQFGYACKQLGVDIKTSSVPQAKGRVERVNNTLQSRLPVELRLNGITSIEEANEFLKSYTQKFNCQFALPINNTKSVFEVQPSLEKINTILAILSSRKIDNGCCIKYNNKYYIPTNNNGKPVHYRKGTHVLVIKAFDGELYATVNEEIHALTLIPDYMPVSKGFELTKLPSKPKKKYIPSMSHPWKKKSFDQYLEKVSHRKNTA